jgi:DNA-binding MarR family transcriptional regulator
MSRTPATGTTDAAPSAPVVTAQQVGEAYLQLVHRMRRVADERLAGSGLSLPRVKLMQYLAASGPTRQNVIATCFDVAPRSVTDMVDCLERGGLAERQDDPTDRRAKLVSLTPTGHDAAASAGHERDQVFEEIFGVLDAGARATFLDFLTTLDKATVTTGEPSPCEFAEPLTSRSNA